MNFVSPELDIKELKHDQWNVKVLCFRFKGKFTSQTSITGSTAWTNYLMEHPSSDFEFVWDCSQMTGFEISARKEWYDAMKEYKRRIVKCYVISDRIMIRSAAKVMLQFFGIPSEIVKSESDLDSRMLKLG